MKGSGKNASDRPAETTMTGALPVLLINQLMAGMQEMPPTAIQSKVAPNNPGLAFSRSLANGIWGAQVPMFNPKIKKIADTACHARRVSLSAIVMTDMDYDHLRKLVA